MRTTLPERGRSSTFRVEDDYRPSAWTRIRFASSLSGPFRLNNCQMIRSDPGQILQIGTCHTAGMNQTQNAPARSQFNILRQICNFIPGHEVTRIARETGAEDKARTFK